jgi:WD40 repeat protein
MKINRFVALALVLAGGGMACTRSDAQKEAEVQVAAQNNADDDVRSRDEPPFWDAAFLPDGKQLLSASGAGVILWDLGSTNVIRVMDESRGSVKMALSEDGKWVLAAAGYVHLWEVSTGKRVSIMKSEQNVVHALALSVDKRLALVGGNGPYKVVLPADKFPDNLQLWDTTKGAVIHRLLGHETTVASVALSSDGKLALSTSFHVDNDKQTVILWDSKKGKLIRRYEFQDKSAQVCFSPDLHFLKKPVFMLPSAADQ